MNPAIFTANRIAQQTAINAALMAAHNASEYDRANSARAANEFWLIVFGLFIGGGIMAMFIIFCKYIFGV